MANGLKILFVATEAAPLAKVGGMGDVVGALPKILRSMGHDVRIFMPYYGTLPDKVDVPAKPIWVGTAALDKEFEVFEITLPNTDVPVYLLGHAAFAPKRIYGGDDEPWRFTFFANAATQFALNYWKPEIIHCHDWHTGMIPVWLHETPDIATVYTIHNLAYQGPWHWQLKQITSCPDYMEGEKSTMAFAIEYADVVNTVSPTYAQQIQTKEYGEELEDLLTEVSDKVVGILNGIEPDIFDPATDKQITHNFSIETLDKRQGNKAVIQEEVGLTVDSDVFLVGMVSRLVEQKGLDLVLDTLDRFMKYSDAQVVVLGTGQKPYEQELLQLATLYPGRMAAYIMYSDAVARRIYAGADAFLMPSRFEPCGISQMIALRYGCIPLVRHTGGLVDTVFQHNPIKNSGTGYVFDDYDPLGLYTCLVRAWEGFQYKTEWQNLQRRAMVADFSWDKSTEEYEKLYHQLADSLETVAETTIAKTATTGVASTTTTTTTTATSTTVVKTAGIVSK